MAQAGDRDRELHAQDRRRHLFYFEACFLLFLFDCHRDNSAVRALECKACAGATVIYDDTTARYTNTLYVRRQLARQPSATVRSARAARPRPALTTAKPLLQAARRLRRSQRSAARDPTPSDATAGRARRARVPFAGCAVAVAA